MPPLQPLPADVRRVTDRMSDADWDRLTLQLGRYALQKSRRFYWRTGQAGELPYGEVTESLVSKAILLWMTGRRRWNAAEYLDLQTFLMGVIDSLLSHAANGFDNRALQPDNGHAPAVHVTPETALLAQEQTDAADRLLADLIAHAQSDPVALAIIDAMRNGASTRREIVAATGRSIGDIDNALKRLRRAGARLAQAQKERVL